MTHGESIFEVNHCEPITRHSSPITAVDCVILAVAHNAFRGITLDEIKSIMNTGPILIDVRGMISAENARETGLYYQSL